MCVIHVAVGEALQGFRGIASMVEIYDKGQGRFSIEQEE
jgi:hypothetical protein